MEKSIETLCIEKEQKLLKKYFPDSHRATDSETIGEYTKDLPVKIEAEFRAYLEGLWNSYSDAPLVLEEQKLRLMMTENDRQAVDEAYKNAERITLWERITRSNHEDVNHYKGLLYEYTKDLLTIMRIDFLEEITGKHISGKTFDDK